MASTDSLASIIEAIDKFKEKHFSFKKKKFGTYLDRSSISKATKDLIASFPVICSDTITPAVASMVAKATERNCVVMLQLLFSSVYLKGSSGREVLSKWHTNMDNDINMDDLLDIMNSFSEDARTISDREFNEIIKEMGSIIRDNILAEKSLYPISSFSETSINDYIVTEDYKGDTVVIVNEKKSEIKTLDIDEYEINQYNNRQNPSSYNTIIKNKQYSDLGDDLSRNLNDIANELETMDLDDERYPIFVEKLLSATKALEQFHNDVNTYNYNVFDKERSASAKMVSNKLQVDIANNEAILKQATIDVQRISNAISRARLYLDQKIAATNDENKKEELSIRRDELYIKAKEFNLDEEKLKLSKDEFEYRKDHEGKVFGFEKDKFERQKQQEDIRNKLDRDKQKLDERRHKLEKKRFKWQQQRDLKTDEKDAYRQLQADMRDTTDFFQKQLLSTDVKKYNELVPSLLVIRFQAVDPDDDGGINNYRVDSQCIIGVKTRLIPVDSFDIINHMRSIEKNKLSLVNLVRATTKEISFCKDFIAAIDQAKIDAKQNSRLSKSSPIWRVLQNRSNRSVYSRLKKRRANDAGAITTLVVSIEEVNALKKEFDIDLTDPKKAKYMMEQYNLLSFVIVDEQVEVVRFLYDGEKYFQDFAFSMLERETGDNSYKKVINLISKLNR